MCYVMYLAGSVGSYGGKVDYGGWCDELFGRVAYGVGDLEFVGTSRYPFVVGRLDGLSPYVAAIGAYELGVGDGSVALFTGVGGV